jgi:transcriptional regulator with XRE-family HTH domain
MASDDMRLRERTRALINQLGHQNRWERGTGTQVAQLLGIGPSMVSLLHHNRRKDVGVQWGTIQRILAATGLKVEFFTGAFDTEPYYADFLPPGRILELGPVNDRRVGAAKNPRDVVAEVLSLSGQKQVSPEMLAAICAHVDQLSRFTTVTGHEVLQYVTGLREEIDRQVTAESQGKRGAASKRRSAVSQLADGARVRAPGRKRRRLA